MQRSIVRSLSAKRACASTTALVSGLRFPAISAARRACAASMTRCPPGAPAFPCHVGGRDTCLVAQRCLYATMPPTDKGRSTSGEEAEANDENNSDKAAEEHGNADDAEHEGSSVDFSHTPSLRDALPPNDVELPEMSFLKCIEKEIMDEKYRLDKEEGPPPVPVGWTMHHTEGTSFIYGRRIWLPPPPTSSSSASGNASVKTTSNESDGTSNTEKESGEQQQQQEEAAKPQDAPIPRAVEKHFLRLQLTARDASLDPECDVRGEHFPFSFFVQRVRSEGEAVESQNADNNNSDGGGGHSGADLDLDNDAFDEHTFYHDSIEVRCDVVDGELVVDNVVYHGTPSPSSPPSTADADVAAATRPCYVNPFGGYPGPNLDEAEEEVLDGIQGWLAERGVDDQLGEFVGQYAIWIEQAEYELWLQQLRDYVAA